MSKNSGLQLIVAMAVFLAIACRGSLPFTLPFVQDETPTADRESLTTTMLTEEQLTCSVDQSIHAVLKENSGCYLWVSAQENLDQDNPPFPDQESITIYTPLRNEWLACYLPSFGWEHPNIQVRWCGGSTWEVAKKILAEKSDPQADVIWGMAATAILQIQAEGLLEPYKPTGLERVNPRMRDTRSDPPYWIGHSAWMSAFCVNTDKLAEEGLPMPTSWVDLINPIYKGHLVMPNPDTAGTGFLSVSALLQLFTREDERATDLIRWADEKGVEGEEAAWAYMDALHENIILYTNSGTKPCELAAKGTIPIGIAFGSEGSRWIQKGYPIAVVFPKEGSGWEVETVALVRKPEVKPAAKVFVDWAISDSAVKAYAYDFPLTSVPTNVPLPEGYIANPTEQLIKNRFLWASANYNRILTGWLKRYEDKTESGSDVPSGFE
jgi:iron(III) transport system substrate-binding protein